MSLTFREASGYVDCDGARMDRNQCEQLLDLFQREHDALLRIGSIEAVCLARKIRKTWLALSFCASVVWPENLAAEPEPSNVCVLRTLPEKRWAVVPGDAA